MNPVTRRQFLQTTVLAASAVPMILKAAESAKLLRLGLIGCGGYGRTNLRAAFKVGGVEVVALSDVDSAHLEATAAEVEKAQGKKPKAYKLYQEMLQTGGLDAIIIASPPHWHALQLIECLKHPVDVYCEKPLCYDVREGRAMVDAVKRSGRIVQIGFQRRQSPAFRAVRDYIQAGKAGKIICAEANIHYTAGTKDSTPQAPPATLDWDLWCGPGPLIPYSPQVGHVNWRLEKTSGHGHLVDWGIHLIDSSRMILGVGMPQAVQATGGLYYLKGKITTPDVLTAHFDFAECPLTWRHRIWGAEEYTPEVSNGIFFYGENETVFVTDDRWEIIPRGRGKERQVQKASADMGKLHMAEFLEAVASRKQPGCTVAEGYASTTTVKLAMISYETGSKVVWDADKEDIVQNRPARELLKREYRRPWKHPAA